MTNSDKRADQNFMKSFLIIKNSCFTVQNIKNIVKIITCVIAYTNMTFPLCTAIML